MAVIASSVVAILVFLFVAAGGLDKFRSPIQIVVPENYQGPLCVEMVDGSGDAILSTSFAADRNGYLVMPTDLVKSHRNKQLFRKSSGSSALALVAANEWSPIRTEIDPSSTSTFMLYWIGSQSKLEATTSNGAKGVCSQSARRRAGND